MDASAAPEATEAAGRDTAAEAARLAPEAFAERARRIEAEIGRVIVGQQQLVRHTLVGLLANSHVLLEGVPGLGKTMLIRTIGDVIDCTFNRIQFTPDLMPADITGTNILVEEGGSRVFRFQPGPIFANLVLADEINRATPKTQSSLLEAMQEHQVTVARNRYALEAPFFVLATQNPLEMEGTYPLPEAQLDRFLLKVMVPFPSEEDLVAILDRTTGAEAPAASKAATATEIVEMQRLARAVPIAPHVTAYAVSLLAATHPDNGRAPGLVRQYVRYGGSPRGAQALVTAGKILALMDGRFNVALDDVRAAAMPALRHRVILNFEGEAEGITSEAVVRAILDEVAPPAVE
jgi:MoxR-like ATPase